MNNDGVAIIVYDDHEDDDDNIADYIGVVRVCLFVYYYYY